jgi:tetraacyldisaccharide 4'-kinase
MKAPDNIFYAFGRPFSPLYSILMTVRQNLYRKGIFRQHKLPVPVISVGNLTMGGTGKTPTVAYIATLLQDLGHRPAIVSRGYGGTAGKPVNLVSDGNNILMTAYEAGDEPVMLAGNLPGIPVLTGKIRLHPCRYAIEHLQCSIIILDDGFQHLAIARDINLVLFNATTLAGNSRVFPGGELREPVSALHRSDAFLLTGVDDANRQRGERFTDLLRKRFPDKPVFSSSLACAPLVSDSLAVQPLTSEPLPLYAFCAIAHPDRFLSTLAATGAKITGSATFSDHHPYRQTDIDTLCRLAGEVGAKGLVTTEKDRVKLESLRINLPLYTLKTQLQPEDNFPIFLRNRLLSP